MLKEKKDSRLSYTLSEWNVPVNGKSTKFVIVYRPPYSEAHLVPTTVFFDEFAVYLEDVVMCPEVRDVAGDFNLHIDDPENADTKRFFELTTLQKDIAALNHLLVSDLVENYDLLMRVVADKHAPISPEQACDNTTQSALVQ